MSHDRGHGTHHTVGRTMSKTIGVGASESVGFRTIVMTRLPTTEVDADSRAALSGCTLAHDCELSTGMDTHPSSLHRSSCGGVGMGSYCWEIVNQEDWYANTVTMMCGPVAAGGMTTGVHTGCAWSRDPPAAFRVMAQQHTVSRRAGTCGHFGTRAWSSIGQRRAKLEQFCAVHCAHRHNHRRLYRRGGDATNPLVNHGLHR